MRRVCSSLFPFFSRLPLAEKCLLSLILLIQLGFYCYYICMLPIRYDESLSYVHFISKGFATTASYYPFPNNHVLHNLLCCLCVYLPLPVEVSIRLVSMLFSLASAYWFYKLARLVLSPTLSFLSLVVLTCSYPFMLYATQARGYSLLIFFTITLMYASYQLVMQRRNKHRALFVISMVGGMYAIPSFLYTAFSVNLFLFGYILVRQTPFYVSRFFLLNALSACIVFVLYIPLFYVNGIAQVLHPNEDISRFTLSDPHLIDTIRGHMQGSAVFLTGVSHALISYVFLILILALIAGQFRYRRSPVGYLNGLCIVMLVSPLLILVLHRVVPFERTWTYLLVPAALGTGLVFNRIALLSSFVQSTVYTRLAASVIIVSAFSMCVYTLYGFKEKHQGWCFPEYMVAHSTEVLAPEFKHIHSISYSPIDWEYYPAEILYYEIYKRDRAQPLTIQKIGPVLNEDLLILNYQDTARYASQLSVYKEADNNTYQGYTILLRKSVP